MIADLLKPGSNVFYYRGTTRNHAPASVVGLWSFPEPSNMSTLAIPRCIGIARWNVSRFPLCVQIHLPQSAVPLHHLAPPSRL